MVGVHSILGRHRYNIIASKCGTVKMAVLPSRFSLDSAKSKVLSELFVPKGCAKRLLFPHHTKQRVWLIEGCRYTTTIHTTATRTNVVKAVEGLAVPP